MTNAYDNWKENTSREEFLFDLTPYEKLAVIFGNFNYQVQMEFFINGYSIIMILT